jgi:hypothetical protein
MDLRHRLFTLFNVEPGEGLLVILLLAHSFFIGSACIFARSSVYALFLAEFDASFLPYVYVCIGAVVTLLSFIYLKLSERISFTWLLTGSVAFLLVSLVGIRLGLSLTSAASLPRQALPRRGKGAAAGRKWGDRRAVTLRVENHPRMGPRISKDAGQVFVYS